MIFVLIIGLIINLLWLSDVYGNIEQDQHWQHQVFTWTNLNLPSIRSRDICWRTISQEIPEPSITRIKISRTITHHSNRPVVNMSSSDGLVLSGIQPLPEPMTSMAWCCQASSHYLNQWPVWLGAVRHPAITWTNDQYGLVLSGIQPLPEPMTSMAWCCQASSHYLN